MLDTFHSNKILKIAKQGLMVQKFCRKLLRKSNSAEFLKKQTRPAIQQTFLKFWGGNQMKRTFPKNVGIHVPQEVALPFKEILENAVPFITGNFIC